MTKPSHLLLSSILSLLISGCTGEPPSEEPLQGLGGKADNPAETTPLPRALSLGKARFDSLYAQLEWDSTLDRWQGVYGTSKKVLDADVIIACERPEATSLACSLWYAAWDDGPWPPIRHNLSGDIGADGQFNFAETLDASASDSESHSSLALVGFVDGETLVIEDGGFQFYSESPHGSIPGRRIGRTNSRRLAGPFEMTFATGTVTEIDKGKAISAPHRGLTTYFVGEPMNHEDATSTCAKMGGGHLARFRGADPELELDSPHWLGLRRASAAADFWWFDGQPLYGTYWAEGEPSSAGDCVVTDPIDNKWHAVACSAMHPPLCQFDASTAFGS